MEYNEEDNGAAGSIPEFGAIFMSSIVTKKECFKRQLLALPSSKAEFIKHVKAGMVLFLFEFERRLLYGVYQATSDGAMDIVPNAFNYPGKHFPAQVCFTPIWYCNPISEKEFRYVIRENYFSPKKFNFGLSKDQVHRLLCLFSSRKLKNKLPPFQLPGVVDGIDGKDRGQLCHESFVSSENGYIDVPEHDRSKPAVFHDYQINSLDEDNEDNELLIGEGGNAGEILYSLGQRSFLAKRRRIDNSRLIRNDVAENEIYNDEILQAFPIDSPRDSLDEVERLDSAFRLTRIERLLNANQAEKFHNPGHNSGATDDGQFIQRNKFGEYNMEPGSRLAFASECYMNPSDKSKHQDERFLFNESVQREQDVYDIAKCTVYDDDKASSCRQLREVIDDCLPSMNIQLENRYYSGSAGREVHSLVPSAINLHKAEKATVGVNMPANCRIHCKPHFRSPSMEGTSLGNSAGPLSYGQRFIHDRKYPTMEGGVTDHTMDSVLCSAAQTRNAGYYHYGSVDGPVVDDGRYRSSSPLASEYPPFPKQKQHVSPFLLNILPEKQRSQPSISNKFEPSSSMYEDGTTRDVPYVPEHPNFSHGCPSVAANTRRSGTVIENHRQGSLETLYSSQFRSSPYFSRSKISTGTGAMDITPECVDEPLPADTSDLPKSFHHKSPLLKSDLSGQTALDISPVNNRGSIFPKLSSTSLPFHTHRNIERERGKFPYPFVPSKSHYALQGKLVATSCVGDCAPIKGSQERGIFVSNDIICSEPNYFGLGVCDQVRDLTSNDIQFSRISRNMYQKGQQERFEAPHCNSFNGIRESVFTRLTPRQESQVGKERSGTNFESNDCYMNATVNEVMERLQQGNNLGNMNCKLVGKFKHEASAVDENQIQSHAEIIHSGKEKIDETDSVIKGVDEMPKETRIVNFKRRSDAKRIMVGASNDPTADSKMMDSSKAVEVSVLTLKRRRLVRPVFGNVETAANVLYGNNQNLQRVVLDNGDKHNCEKPISNSGAEVPEEAISKVEAELSGDNTSLGSLEASDPENTVNNCEDKVPKKTTNNSKAEASEDNTSLGNCVASDPHQSLECNTEEHSKNEVKNEVGTDVLPSTCHELVGHETGALDPQLGISNLPTETPQQ